MSTLSYAETHLRDIANKSIMAQDNFITNLQAIGDINYEQANGIFGFMLRHKMIKFDVTMARYTVKHGGYLDKEFIEHLAIHGAF